jgi:hypothetical protein
VLRRNDRGGWKWEIVVPGDSRVAGPRRGGSTLVVEDTAAERPDRPGAGFSGVASAGS